VRVRKEDMLGAPGMGFKIAMKTVCTFKTVLAINGTFKTLKARI
jgi:alkylation response protein AidB-like acyl-CoA dehydrogenase